MNIHTLWFSYDDIFFKIIILGNQQCICLSLSFQLKLDQEIVVPNTYQLNEIVWIKVKKRFFHVVEF